MTHELHKQNEVVQPERLPVDRTTRARVQDFANMIAELIARRRRPEVQLKGCGSL